MNKELLEELEKIDILATEVWNKAEEVVVMAYNLKMKIMKEDKND